MCKSVCWGACMVWGQWKGFKLDSVQGKRAESGHAAKSVMDQESLLALSVGVTECLVLWGVSPSSFGIWRGMQRLRIVVLIQSGGLVERSTRTENVRWTVLLRGPWTGLGPWRWEGTCWQGESKAAEGSSGWETWTVGLVVSGWGVSMEDFSGGAVLSHTTAQHVAQEW